MSEAVNSQSGVVGKDAVDAKSSVSDLEKLNAKPDTSLKETLDTSIRRKQTRAEENLALLIRGLYLMYAGGFRYSQTDNVKVRAGLIAANIAAYYLTWRYIRTGKWGWLLSEYLFVCLAARVADWGVIHIDEELERFANLFKTK